MALGFCCGPLFSKPPAARQRVLLAAGAAATAAFFVVRALNVYGDPAPWSVQPTSAFTALSFLNTTKYPPSLAFLLMTLGPALLILAKLERGSFSRANPLIVFGLTSTDWPGGVNPDYPTGGSVCFYQGTNYTGAELCMSSGRVIHDLALLGIDNGFSSIKVFGASAAVCRDRDFQSYCERIISDQPVLDQYLRRALSSIRVY